MHSGTYSGTYSGTHSGTHSGTTDTLQQMLNAYDPSLGLTRASTPPASWYTEPEFFRAECRQVFHQNWLLAARVEQLHEAGDYLALDVAGEPILLVRDQSLRAFYNVCRHHAAQVMPEGEGCAKALHCPYHGWTYNLDGSLRRAPKFDGAENFNPDSQGLVSIRVDTWANWIFVCLNPQSMSLQQYLGDLMQRLGRLDVTRLEFTQRVSYEMNCNWKVYVDNYLDGGYHVPFLHKDLSSALDNSGYQIETATRYCLQSCPIASEETGSAVRTGDMAYYYWLYPNTMINWYEGVMDVNIVQPVAPDRCRVHFDYYFEGQSDAFRQQSIALAHQVQKEDIQISESVQRGLHSASYDTGRLSPVKEAGEHLFHRLLHADMQRALSGNDT